MRARLVVLTHLVFLFLSHLLPQAQRAIDLKPHAIVGRWRLHTPAPCQTSMTMPGSRFAAAVPRCARCCARPSCPRREPLLCRVPPVCHGMHNIIIIISCARPASVVFGVRNLCTRRHTAGAKATAPPQSGSPLHRVYCFAKIPLFSVPSPLRSDRCLAACFCSTTVLIQATGAPSTRVNGRRA